MNFADQSFAGLIKNGIAIANAKIKIKESKNEDSYQAKSIRLVA